MTGPPFCRIDYTLPTLTSPTQNEVEIIKLVAEGLRNREVAGELHVSEKTVGVHLRNIFAKLDVNDRTSAVSVSLRRGIIHLD